MADKNRNPHKHRGNLRELPIDPAEPLCGMCFYFHNHITSVLENTFETKLEKIYHLIDFQGNLVSFKSDTKTQNQFYPFFGFHWAF